MGVDVGVTVAGEVLGAGGDAARLQAPDVGGRVPGPQAGVRPEGPYADDGVVGVGVDVGGRRPVEVHAARGQAPAQLPCDTPGEVRIVHGAERVVAGERGARTDVQAGDVAALLVDGDQQLVPFR